MSHSVWSDLGPDYLLKPTGVIFSGSSSPVVLFDYPGSLSQHVVSVESSPLLHYRLYEYSLCLL